MINNPNSESLLENVSIRNRGRLPHWESEYAIYFVTFRLADSLSANVLEQYSFERKDIVQTAETLHRDLTPFELARLDELYSEKIESFLDSGSGACYLTNPRVAQVVRDALFHFNDVRYQLIVWCVMPNHVHVVLKPLREHSLADIMHSWKSFTAKSTNRILGRTGEFWQREYYDHLIRDEDDFCRILEYVLENPRKAGLQDWPWFGMSNEL